MKLVITIDDDIYDDYLKQGATVPKYGTAIGSLYEALWNGVPLPEHHGRLIDADAIMKIYGLEDATKYGNETAEQQTHSYDTMMMYEIADMLDDAPTIIEGSESD